MHIPLRILHIYYLNIAIHSMFTNIANLQGKLADEAKIYAQERVDVPNTLITNQLVEDAIEALTTLQYSQRESERLVMSAVRSDTELNNLEELLVYILENQAPT